MKYLVVNKGLRAGVSAANIPLSTFQAAGEWFKAKRADGTIESIYSFVTAGGIGIMNANSHEDIMKILRSSPTWTFAEIEVHPLCDFDQSFNALLEARQKMGK